MYRGSVRGMFVSVDNIQEDVRVISAWQGRHHTDCRDPQGQREDKSKESTLCLFIRPQATSHGQHLKDVSCIQDLRGCFNILFKEKSMK